FWSHDLLRDQDAEFAQLGKHGIDASAGFNCDDHRERIAAYFKVRDLLQRAVVGDDEILLVEIVNHGAAAVADGDGSDDQRGACREFGQRFGRSWLDWRARSGGHGAFGGLREGGRCRKRKTDKASQARFGGGQHGENEIAPGRGPRPELGPRSTAQIASSTNPPVAGHAYRLSGTSHGRNGRRHGVYSIRRAKGRRRCRAGYDY